MWNFVINKILHFISRSFHSLLYVLILFPASMFPSATGICYRDENGKAIAVIVRENRYVEPEGGWLAPGRIFLTQEKIIRTEEPKETPKTGSTKYFILFLNS